GVYNPANGTFFMKNTNAAGPADLTPQFIPIARFKPVVGNWSGTGTTTMGQYDPSNSNFYLTFSNVSTVTPDLSDFYGPPGAGFLPLAGNWNGAALRAAALAPPGADAGAAPLTDAALQPIVHEAIQRYAAAGLPAELVQELAAVPVEVADLGNGD